MPKSKFVTLSLSKRPFGHLTHSRQSLLHVLVICNTEMHTAIAKALILKFPALVDDIFESDEYFGKMEMQCHLRVTFIPPLLSLSSSHTMGLLLHPCLI